jgi:hypothetical protein
MIWIPNILNLPISSTIATNDVKSRVSSQSKSPSTLTDIYRDDVNLAVWQHSLNEDITPCIESLIKKKPKFSTVMILTPDNAYQHIAECLNDIEHNHSLCEHISLLVDMFCTLFELECAGLRLKLLNQPMCPKFHVDNVPCRLVTTLHGPATQWLPHSAVNRGKLGRNSNGLADECSGIINPDSHVEQLSCGDIALLKGENWHNNEQAGLVHRSPSTAQNIPRLLLTLDFAS